MLEAAEYPGLIKTQASRVSTIIKNGADRALVAFNWPATTNRYQQRRVARFVDILVFAYIDRLAGAGLPDPKMESRSNLAATVPAHRSLCREGGRNGWIVSHPGARVAQ